METTNGPQEVEAARRRVFVVHGRNHAARDATVAFLRALGVEVIEWEHARQMTGVPQPFTADIVAAGIRAANAVVVLFTGDEEVRLVGEEEVSRQARPNVIFEAGLAWASKGPSHCVFISFEGDRSFSDIDGVNVVRTGPRVTSATRQQIANRLRDAGVDVNLSGTDWHSAGDFDAAMAPKALTSQRVPDGAAAPLSKSAPASPEAAKPRALVCASDMWSADSHASHLSMDGFGVRICRDGISAIGLLNGRERIEVLVIHDDIGDADSTIVVRTARQVRPALHIVGVVNGNVERRAELVLAGANAVLDGSCLVEEVVAACCSGIGRKPRFTAPDRTKWSDEG